MSKITKQNVGGTDYTMVGCALTGVCASAADAFIKAVILSDGDEISDGMTVIVTFANGNTAGTAPASKTIYSSDQVNYYEDSGLTVPFTLAPAGCYTITYTGEGNAYTYISYPVIQIGNVTGVLCDASGNTVSGSLWAKGAQIGIMFKDGKFLLISGALLNNMSALPTDAVLHYSFDDVPDYPDGIADVRLLNNNTYDIQSTNYKFYSNSGTTFSNENGNLKVVIVGGNWTGTYQLASYLQNKIVRFKIKVTDLVGTLTIRAGGTTLKDITSIGVYDVMEVHPTDTGSNQLYCFCFGAGNSCTFTVEQIYIGDGSYATPVIDNANGEWNSTSQSGVAIQGVSGKGYKQFSGLATTIGKFNFGNNLTVSIWVNPETDENGLIGNILYKDFCISIRNGFTTNNYFYYAFWNSSTSAWQYLTTTRLLPKNTWTHVVITKNGTTVKLYLNGVLSKTSTIANDISVNNYDFNIGSTNNTRPQSYDDLLIFNRALSETEVKALYLNRGNTPKYYPPVSIPASKIPLPPSTDGNYKLRCTVSDGVPSYSWGGTVKGETVRNLGGVQTYTITLPVNLSSSANVYRVLKGCLCLGELETACFEITYGQRPNNNVSVPNVSFMSSSLTMTYNQADRTITFSSTTKFFYACIYSIQEIESYLGLPLTFV